MLNFLKMRRQMKYKIDFWLRELSWKMYDVASILFDDSKNDMRSLPKAVRLQILVTLSFLWSTVFTIFIWQNLNNAVYGWAGLVLGHVVIIIACYFTFRLFKNLKIDYSKFGDTVGSWDDCIDYLKKKDKK